MKQALSIGFDRLIPVPQTSPYSSSSLPHPGPAGTLEPHLSALLWMAMLVSLAIVIVLPQPHGIRALIASTILRLIFSVGLEPTLLLLGVFNVSMFICSDRQVCIYIYVSV